MHPAHITIHTEALDKSIAFYQDVLDLAISEDMRPNLPIVFMESKGSPVRIELIEDPKNPFAGSGLSIGFHADDVEKTREDLVRRGYAPTEIIRPAPGVKFFYLKDPSGVPIQII